MVGWTVETRINKWPQLIRNFRPEVSSILSKVAHDGFAQSQMDCPVDTRYLLNTGSINGGDLEFTITYAAHYAGYVHEGTARVNARPFLKLAVDNQVGGMVGAFGQLEGRVV